MANTKLDLLIATRTRALKTLEHRIQVIKTFTDETDLRRVKASIQILENTWNEFKVANDDCDGQITEDAQLAQFTQIAFNAEDSYLDARLLLQELNEEAEATEANSRNISSPNTDPIDSSIKLCRLTIKPFSGKYEDWAEFRDIFRSCIKQNSRIPDIQKLHQLKSLLSDEPATLIKNLKMQDNNFEIAWKTLDDHYDNPNKVVWGYLQRFFEIPTISTGTASATDLRNMIITTSDLIQSLPDFQIDTTSWDTILIYVLIQKLDTVTINYWHEDRKAEKGVPSFKRFRTFLETRLSVCESKEGRRKSALMPTTSTPKLTTQKMITKPVARSLLSQTTTVKCELCDKEHRTYQCSKLINAPYERRLELVREKKLCENCLYPHETGNCISRYSCRACGDRHHTLLHPLQKTLHTQINKVEENDDDDEELEAECGRHAILMNEADEDDETVAHVNLCSNNDKIIKSTLLATALIPVFTQSGSTILLRTLFDQGSEASLITSNAHQMINTERIIENIPVVAVGNTPAGIIKYSTNIVIGSLYNNKYRYSFRTLITKTITNVNPQSIKNTTNWTHIKDLELADPKYFESGQIDLLLGVNEIAELLLPGLVKGDRYAPIAQQTKIGWILSGTCGIKTPYVRCHSITTEHQTLSDILKAFWMIEEIPSGPTWSPEERAAEEHFIKNVRRHKDGKLIVRLPFKSDPNDPNFLGRSYELARSRFFQVEKKLMRNETHYDEYRKCMNEYIDLGHMRPATVNEKQDGRAYFLPHHAVVKESSETTKLRVVFDASCKSNNGKSLNDQLYVGPTIQKDLFTLLIQWRKLKIAFTGDIEKMYRQIWVENNDAMFQRIIWRNSNTEPLQEYILQTITFGTSSAPFQAIRCLFKIADDIRPVEPSIATLIKENFYVDDFLGNAETVTQAIKMREKTQTFLEEYGFNLRKWKSNSVEFLQTVNPDIQSESIEHTFESPCKALGLQWHPRNDYFYFKLEFDITKTTFTKRHILSETAKIFDPLGWLAPCTVKAKILMQKLWLLPIDWDDKVPIDIETNWLKFRDQLNTCSEIQIPRWIGYSSKNETISIHGFADASEEAYAAAVYVCTKHNNETHVSLMAAKTKVAPLKRLTIPHLELSAARLLADLVGKVKNALNIPNITITAWTDSMVVLGWLAAPPHHWQTFVANRVSQIQELIPTDCWKHVPTKLNPADCASRGLYLNELKSHNLWWTGPPFLSQSNENWPRRHVSDPNCILPDRRKSKKIQLISAEPEYHEILNRFSSLRTLLHVTAYCLRWKNYKREARFQSTTLNVIEVDEARTKWLKLIQGTHFAKEITCLKAKNQSLPRNSTIMSLNPKLDEQLVLRVNGRLTQSNLSRDQKEPIILPKTGHFTELVIQDAHHKTFHGGNQLTLQKLRQQYWVLQGRNTIKSYLHKCTICFKFRNRASQQLMGDLPKFRINECRPFTYTGVDFAGYFDIKTSTRKNAPYTKAYIAVFVCLTTKAMHLEVVSSLTTDAFLMAFKRFVARKLVPKHMYSDRGTNFIGAKNELPRLFQNARSEQMKEVRDVLLKYEIEWHLIPAHAPHFGGIWEAGVKSTKYHLKRVLGNARLNFEEFTTIIAQIEACLNSRPLYPQTEDPQDDLILTPNHLVFAYESSALPEPCSSNIPTQTINRYQLLQRLHADFWRKWSQEYLTRLMHRSKWTKQEENMRPNQIVLIKEDNLPPTKWLYGRIIKVHPGKDGLVRVADVKCKNSILSRPIHKLCLLPIVDNQTESNHVLSD